MTKSEKEEMQKTKKHSIIDGAGNSVMIGAGEQYVIPYALHLGASAPQIGLLSTIPTFLGSLSQLVGARLLRKTERKKLVLISVLAQTISIIPLFAIPFLTKSSTLLILFFGIYYLASNLGGPAWNSWIGEVIPAEERSSYFAARNKYTTIALFATVLAAGLILQATKTKGTIGFAILFSIAFIGRLISHYHLKRQYEPPMQQPNIQIPLRTFLKKLHKEPFGNFVIFRSAMSLAIMIAAPFFAVYMLRELGFSYIHYMAVILMPMLAKIISAKVWANYAQTFGNRTLMQTTTVIITIIPLGWFLAGTILGDTPHVFTAILIVEALSGMGWAGFELTTFNYMLETTTPAIRATFFAYFNLLFGTAILIGGLSGVGLNILLENREATRTLLSIFLISTGLRALVASILMPRIPQVAIHPKISQGKLFYELFVQRPLGFAVAPMSRYGVLQGKTTTINDQTKKTIQRLKGSIINLKKTTKNREQTNNK